MAFTAVHILTNLPEQQDLLIGLLSEKGFSGFEEREDRLIAFIAEQDGPDHTELAEWLTARRVAFDIQTVPDTNWNAVWESSFSPVQIDNFCAIRAAFHPPVPDVLHDIMITPRMTFGTGHHSTTASMIRLMKDMELKGKSVFDFGTGTGILAILASRMGATKIWAVDNDPSAIENARENALENEASNVNFLCADEPDMAWGKVDCILVNIQLQVILSHLSTLTELLRPGGSILLSGVLENNYPLLAAAIEQYPYQLVKLTCENNWIAGRWEKG